MFILIALLSQFCFRIFKHLFVSTIPSMKTNSPIPVAEIQPQTITLLPTCFTVPCWSEIFNVKLFIGFTPCEFSAIRPKNIELTLICKNYSFPPRFFFTNVFFGEESFLSIHIVNLWLLSVNSTVVSTFIQHSTNCVRMNFFPVFSNNSAANHGAFNLGSLLTFLIILRFSRISNNFGRPV